MEPPRSIPVPVSLPARPTRHFAYSFDEPVSHYRNTGGPSASNGGGYVSPDPTPTAAAFYQQQSHSTPVRQASYTAPRGYPAQSANLFTNSALGPNGHNQSPQQGGYQSPPGEYAFGYGDTPPRYAGSGQMGSSPEMDPFFVPVLPMRKEEKKGKKARKGPEVKQPTFLTKLYGILEQQEYNHILRWDTDGETIIIERPTELGEKVLPLVYRQSRFASFSRQLNIYGWRRKLSLRNVEEGISDPDASTWSHSSLHRNSPIEEILNFKRRVGPRPSQSKRRYSVPEQVLSPTGSDLSDPEDAYHRHLLSEDIKPNLPPSYPTPTPPSQTPDRGYDDLVEISPFSDDYPLQPEMPVYSYNQRDDQAPHQPYPTQQGQAGLGLAFGSSTPVIQPNFTPAAYGASTPSYTPYFPQSAPLMADKNYMDHQVYQAHLRTRSVQGDPPSATLWSASPYGANSWGPPLSALPSANDFQGAPTPRVQEGWVNCYTNEPMSPPPNSLGMVGARMASATAFNGAQSVPTSFAPLSASTTNGNEGLGEAFQLRPTSGHSRHDSLSSTTGPPPSLPPATVSPGVYQTGFTPPSAKPPVNLLTRSVSSPRRTPTYISFVPGGQPSATRQERRQSISSTPYSPRHRQLSLAQLSMSPSRGPRAGGMGGGGVGGLSGAGMSDGYKSSSMGTPELAIPELPPVIVGEKGYEVEVDEALPSAGMEGFAESPFAGLLRGKEELMDGDE